MNISQNCLDLVKHYEGFKLEAYKCPAGINTIGYGTTMYPDGTRVHPGDLCNEATAEIWLQWELNNAAQFIDNHKLILNQNQVDACCSFIYNLGAGAFLKSTLFQLIQINPNNPGILQEFYKWVHAGGIILKGLQHRRLSEAHLYFTGQLKFDWL